MRLSSEDLKMICALERQIDNHSIKKLVATTDCEKFLKFEDGKGWTMEAKA